MQVKDWKRGEQGKQWKEERNREIKSGLETADLGKGNSMRTIVVLAMSVDGKIADRERSPARFGSAADKAHLERQVAQADGVLFGAETLRAYGTTLLVKDLGLLQQREQQGKPPQPVQIVCSGSGDLNPQFPFFRQPVPRWLLTTEAGAQRWSDRPEFQQVFSFEQSPDWQSILGQFGQLGLETLIISGGGGLIAALLEADLIDEFWLTICPLILGGTSSPTPVGGTGFPASFAPQLELRSAQTIEQEVFLHYHRKREKT